MDNAGAVAGLLLAAWLLEQNSDLRFGWIWQSLGASMAFGFSAVCAVSAAIPLGLWCRE